MTFRITTLHAWTQVDDGDEEGIIATLGADGTDAWLPLIGADEDRIRSLRPVAEGVARATGRPVQLRRFDNGVIVDEIQP